MSYDFAGLNARLLDTFRELMAEWLPGGKTVGAEYVCADVRGGAGKSLSVNMQSGKWADFAGTVKGGDLVSLYAAIRGVDQGEAYRLLGGDQQVNGHATLKASALAEPPDDAAIEVHRPPNVDFSVRLFTTPTLGTPSKVWVYRDAHAEPLFVVARYETKEGKRIQPWIWNGLKWQMKGHPKPRPLYGLDRLAAINNPVLLVEGEKTADAAQFLFPTRPCITWCGGCGQAMTADWQPLASRVVTIWPDNDEIGKSTAMKIAARLVSIGATVTMVDPFEWPESWDLADALESGTPKARILEYAKTHSRAIKPIEVREPKKKTVAATYEQKPINGSLYETWARHNFVLRSNGRPYGNHANVINAIRAKGDMDIYYEEFTERIMIGDQPWTEAHAGDLTVFLQMHFGMPDIWPNVVHRGVEIYALQRRRNKLTDWLRGLEWDKVERIPQLMSQGFGAKETEYTRAVGRCFMIGLVARALKPGIKADCMPVFEGAQGVYKSSALSIIGGDYFVEIHENVNSKDFYLTLRGKLLGEIAELESFSKADIRKVKNVMSTRTDTYRKPYEREAADHPRACLFAGTTNHDDWNTDETGARRFWPIRCGIIDRQWLKENRSQFFAEAIVRYERGEDWWTVPEESAGRQREARRQIDPWEGPILRYVGSRDVVHIETLLSNCVDLKVSDANMLHARRVGAILRANGWSNKVRWMNGKAERRWRREDDTIPAGSQEVIAYETNSTDSGIL
jgi:hypothetical protein